MSVELLVFHKTQETSHLAKQSLRHNELPSMNIVQLLTGRKMRQLTGVSRKISPMQRVDANTHLRGENDFVRVPAKHKGRTTRHAVPETTEGFRAE